MAAFQYRSRADKDVLGDQGCAQPCLGGGAGNIAVGSAFVLGSALCYAFYLLGTGEMVRRIGSLRLVAYAMCVSSAACSAARHRSRSSGTSRSCTR